MLRAVGNVHDEVAPAHEALAFERGGGARLVEGDARVAEQRAVVEVDPCAGRDVRFFELADQFALVRRVGGEVLEKRGETCETAKRPRMVHRHPQRERAAEAEAEHTGVRRIGQRAVAAKCPVNERLQIVHEEIGHLRAVELRREFLVALAEFLAVKDGDEDHIGNEPVLCEPANAVVGGERFVAGRVECGEGVLAVEQVEHGMPRVAAAHVARRQPHDRAAVMAEQRCVEFAINRLPENPVVLQRRAVLPVVHLDRDLNVVQHEVLVVQSDGAIGSRLLAVP